MKRKKRIGLFYLVLSFIAVFVLTAAFFSYVFIKNAKKTTYKGTVLVNNKETADEEYKNFRVLLNISKSWVNDENTANQNYGQQFDFEIGDGTKYELRNWSLTINFDDNDFLLLDIDSEWNVESVIDGKKIIITPLKDITLRDIKPTEKNSFGFIFIVKNEMTADNFSNFTFTLAGTPHRIVTSYPMFWIDLLLIFSLVAAFISYLVYRIRERHFEAFKEHTYSIISESMNTFASLIDFKDPYTKDHSARVSYYSVKIAKQLGLDEEFVRNIAYIALMHDCGKLLIDDDILSKPSKLTDGEYNIMKTHTTNGGRALENFTSIEGIKDGAMYHHERWDGMGYPKGLRGEEIPLCARIISVADALDAMSSDRCYRKRLSKDKILKELEECAGGQFDPTIARLTISMINNGIIDINEKKK